MNLLSELELARKGTFFFGFGSLKKLILLISVNYELALSHKMLPIFLSSIAETIIM